MGPTKGRSMKQTNAAKAANAASVVAAANKRLQDNTAAIEDLDSRIGVLTTNLNAKSQLLASKRVEIVELESAID